MKYRILALLLAVSLLMSGCTFISSITSLGRDDGPRDHHSSTEPKTTEDTDTKPGETEPLSEPEGETEPTPATETAPATEPAPTEPEVEPAYYGYDTGLMVRAGDVVLAADLSWIVRCRNGEKEFLLNTGCDQAREICSDGQTLFYINGDNVLMSYDLETERERAITDPFDGTTYIDACVFDLAFVSVWYDDSWAPTNYAVYLDTGEVVLLEGHSAIKNEDGYFILRDFATDVSPRLTTIIDPEGETILEDVRAWSTGMNRGVLWYAASEMDPGAGKYTDDYLTIYEWHDGVWEMVVNVPTTTDWAYGGKLVDDAYCAFDGSNQCYSIATGAALDESRSTFLMNVQSIYDVDGTVYYKERNRLWRQDSADRMTLVLELDEVDSYYPLEITDAVYAYTMEGVMAFELQ